MNSLIRKINCGGNYGARTFRDAFSQTTCAFSSAVGVGLGTVVYRVEKTAAKMWGYCGSRFWANLWVPYRSRCWMFSQCRSHKGFLNPLTGLLCFEWIQRLRYISSTTLTAFWYFDRKQDHNDAWRNKYWATETHGISRQFSRDSPPWDNEPTPAGNMDHQPRICQPASK